MIINGECGAFNPLLLEVLNKVADTLKERVHMMADAQQEHSFDKFSQEIMSTKELSASRRTLDLLDRERQKYQFITAFSKEFLFEIHVNPVAIRFFDESVHRLGVKQYIPNPLEDDELRKCMSDKALKDIANLVSKATKDDPIVNYETDVVMEGSAHRCKIKIMKQYSLEEDYVYSGAVGKMEDITADYRQRAELERAATHDPLTGLLNKAHSAKLMEYYLKNHKKTNYALAFVDLDNFKKINDTYGHQKGDQVILTVTETMRKNVPAGGLCARVGGDEFVAFWKDNGKLKQCAKDLFDAINGSFTEGIGSISMGVAQTSVVGRDFATLYKKADIAAYSVKNNGKAQFCIYNDSLKDFQMPE